MPLYPQTFWLRLFSWSTVRSVLTASCVPSAVVHIGKTSVIYNSYEILFAIFTPIAKIINSKSQDEWGM